MILTLYKNYDTTQPVQFKGRSKEGLLYQLQKWLDKQNGEIDLGTRRHKPLWADGIAIIPSGRGAIVLMRNGKGWEIRKGAQGKLLTTTSWIVARAIFLHYAYAYCKKN